MTTCVPFCRKRWNSMIIPWLFHDCGHFCHFPWLFQVRKVNFKCHAFSRCSLLWKNFVRLLIKYYPIEDSLLLFSMHNWCNTKGEFDFVTLTTRASFLHMCIHWGDTAFSYQTGRVKSPMSAILNTCEHLWLEKKWEYGCWVILHMHAKLKPFYLWNSSNSCYPSCNFTISNSPQENLNSSSSLETPGNPMGLWMYVMVREIANTVTHETLLLNHDIHLGEMIK